MRKDIKWMILAMLLLLTGSCEEYKMISYGEGGQINFMGWDEFQFENDNPEHLTWSRNFGVNPQGDSLQVDTLKVGVKIMGMPAGHPRKVVFKVAYLTGDQMQIESSPDGYVVPAGEGKAAFKFVVKRPAKRNVVYQANLEFNYEASDFTPGTVERQLFKLECSDIVNKETWHVEDNLWMSVSDLLGDWSETKARFIITTLGVTDFTKWASDIYNVYLDYFTLYSELEDYKAKSAANPEWYPPLWDETKLPNQVWISFPIIY